MSMLSPRGKKELKINQRRILINSIEIGIPAPEQVVILGQRHTSNGKVVGRVRNSKTLNYKSFTPHRDGLFCERIFGPVQSYICACGKQGPLTTSKGTLKFCPRCEVEYTDQRARRYRIGYIGLVSPVTHIWHLKGRPSYLSLFLGKRKKTLATLAYCNDYLVEQAFSKVDTGTGFGLPPSGLSPRFAFGEPVLSPFEAKQELRSAIRGLPERSSGYQSSIGFEELLLPGTTLRLHGPEGPRATNGRNVVPDSHFTTSVLSSDRQQRAIGATFFKNRILKGLKEPKVIKGLTLSREKEKSKVWLPKATFTSGSISNKVAGTKSKPKGPVLSGAEQELRSVRLVAPRLQSEAKFDKDNRNSVSFLKYLRSTKDSTTEVVKRLTDTTFRPLVAPGTPFRQSSERRLRSQNVVPGSKRSAEPFFDWLPERSSGSPRMAERSSCSAELSTSASCSAELSRRVGLRPEGGYPNSVSAPSSGQVKQEASLKKARFSYTRSQTLPFLPTFICEFHLRDGLLSFFDSFPPIEDIPIPIYCKIPRRYPLRDVHKFMTDQAFSKVQVGQSSTKGRTPSSLGVASRYTLLTKQNYAVNQSIASRLTTRFVEQVKGESRTPLGNLWLRNNLKSLSRGRPSLIPRFPRRVALSELGSTVGEPALSPLSRSANPHSSEGRVRSRNVVPGSKSYARSRSSVRQTEVARRLQSGPVGFATSSFAPQNQRREAHRQRGEMSKHNQISRDKIFDFARTSFDKSIDLPLGATRPWVAMQSKSFAWPHSSYGRLPKRNFGSRARVASTRYAPSPQLPELRSGSPRMALALSACSAPLSKRSCWAPTGPSKSYARPYGGNRNVVPVTNRRLVPRSSCLAPKGLSTGSPKANLGLDVSSPLLENVNEQRLSLREVLLSILLDRLVTSLIELTPKLTTYFNRPLPTIKNSHILVGAKPTVIMTRQVNTKNKSSFFKHKMVSEALQFMRAEEFLLPVIGESTACLPIRLVFTDDWSDLASLSKASLGNSKQATFGQSHEADRRRDKVREARNEVVESLTGTPLRQKFEHASSKTHLEESFSSLKSRVLRGKVKVSTVRFGESIEDWLEYWFDRWLQNCYRDKPVARFVSLQAPLSQSTDGQTEPCSAKLSSRRPGHWVTGTTFCLAAGEKGLAKPKALKNYLLANRNSVPACLALGSPSANQSRVATNRNSVSARGVQVWFGRQRSKNLIGSLEIARQNGQATLRKPKTSNTPQQNRSFCSENSFSFSVFSFMQKAATYQERVLQLFIKATPDSAKLTRVGPLNLTFARASLTQRSRTAQFGDLQVIKNITRETNQDRPARNSGTANRNSVTSKTRTSCSKFNKAKLDRPKVVGLLRRRSAPFAEQAAGEPKASEFSVMMAQWPDVASLTLDPARKTVLNNAEQARTKSFKSFKVLEPTGPTTMPYRPRRLYKSEAFVQTPINNSPEGLTKAKAIKAAEGGTLVASPPKDFRSARFAEGEPVLSPFGAKQELRALVLRTSDPIRKQPELRSDPVEDQVLLKQSSSTLPMSRQRFNSLKGPLILLALRSYTLGLTERSRYTTPFFSHSQISSIEIQLMGQLNSTVDTLCSGSRSNPITFVLPRNIVLDQFGSRRYAPALSPLSPFGQAELLLGPEEAQQGAERPRAEVAERLIETSFRQQGQPEIHPSNNNFCKAKSGGTVVPVSGLLSSAEQATSDNEIAERLTGALFRQVRSVGPKHNMASYLFKHEQRVKWVKREIVSSNTNQNKGISRLALSPSGPHSSEGRVRSQNVVLGSKSAAEPIFDWLPERSSGSPKRLLSSAEQALVLSSAEQELRSPIRGLRPEGGNRNSVPASTTTLTAGSVRSSILVHASSAGQRNNSLSKHRRPVSVANRIFLSFSDAKSGREGSVTKIGRNTVPVSRFPTSDTFISLLGETEHAQNRRFFARSAPRPKNVLKLDSQVWPEVAGRLTGTVFRPEMVTIFKINELLRNPTVASQPEKKSCGWPAAFGRKIAMWNRTARVRNREATNPNAALGPKGLALGLPKANPCSRNVVPGSKSFAHALVLRTSESFGRLPERSSGYPRMAERSSCWAPTGPSTSAKRLGLRPEGNNRNDVAERLTGTSLLSEAEQRPVPATWARWVLERFRGAIAPSAGLGASQTKVAERLTAATFRQAKRNEEKYGEEEGLVSTIGDEPEINRLGGQIGRPNDAVKQPSIGFERRIGSLSRPSERLLPGEAEHDQVKDESKTGPNPAQLIAATELLSEAEQRLVAPQLQKLRRFEQNATEPAVEKGSSDSYMKAQLDLQAIQEVLSYTGGGALKELLRCFDTQAFSVILLNEIKLLREYHKGYFLHNYDQVPNKATLGVAGGRPEVLLGPEEAQHWPEEPKTVLDRTLPSEQGRLTQNYVPVSGHSLNKSKAGRLRSLDILRSGFSKPARWSTVNRIKIDNRAEDENDYEELPEEINRFSRAIHRNARRLKIVQLLMRNKRRPEWMLISALPVLPPDLRPILQMSENLIVASDLNTLYQRVIYRNNRQYKLRIVEWSYATSLQRLVQDAVDRLLENGKGGSKPFLTPNGRPLKSLSDTLKGKKGRFRLNLLGKRVDFSGRSVIVVSPHLKIHECGLPREMALELYQYLLIRQMLLKRQVSSVIIAKRLIRQQKAFVWDTLRELIYHHPVLLNRAPTLHRLGIQAFQPKLVLGSTILLHPLVCTGFNADFDGDQMGVHLPLCDEARAEAWDLLWSRNNLLSPATGEPILLPSQDMVLGFYHMTALLPCLDANLTAKTTGTTRAIARSADKTAQTVGLGFVQIDALSASLRTTTEVASRLQSHFFSSLGVVRAYQKGDLDIHTPIWLQWNGKIEDNDSDQTPLEVRINSFGVSTQLYPSYKSRKDASSTSTATFNQFIRTTPGRVIVNNIFSSSTNRCNTLN